MNCVNYIYWIEDLFVLFFVLWFSFGDYLVIGFDIGMGVNCIYLLFGIFLYGWRFVGIGNGIVLCIGMMY